MLRRLKKGQSTAEYAVVIGLVIAAAVAMQVYVKRGIQGKMKDAADYNDPAATMLRTTQYEPNYQTTENMTATRDATETTSVKQGGSVTRDIKGEEVSSRVGTTKILAVGN
ncbi:MAG: hypothetical protein PHS66_06685 [Candidatus Omnitrophica bacterium]|nr:hypothetical protein [Candidatus Omnitrophota bacterium]